jgi:hypothetical protein
MFSCKKTSGKIDTTSKNDTLYLKENTVIFISPSSEKLDKLKKIYGNDFHTIVNGDNSNYAKSVEYLDSLHIKYFNQKDDIVIAYKKGKILKTIPKSKRYWYSVFYKDGEYKISNLVNFRNEYNIFFNKKIKNLDGLEKWYGVYLNTDLKKLKSYKAIMDTIGWYKLTIKANGIIFESDERMETQYPVVAPGGICVNYICDYKFNKDTLVLYDKKEEDKSKQPKLLYNSKEEPVLKIYKKEGKYYGLSSDIFESENLVNAVRGKSGPPYLFIKFDK